MGSRRQHVWVEIWLRLYTTCNVVTRFVGLPEPSWTFSKSNGKIRPNILADDTEYLMYGQHPCSLKELGLTYLRSHFFAPSSPRPMDSGSDDVADQSIEENLDLRQVLPSPQEDIPQ